MRPRLRASGAVSVMQGPRSAPGRPIILPAPRIISLFDPSAHPTVMAAGTTYVRINTMMLPMAAIAMVANGALRGAGDTLPAMFSTLLTRGVVSVVALQRLPSGQHE